VGHRGGERRPPVGHGGGARRRAGGAPWWRDEVRRSGMVAARGGLDCIGRERREVNEREKGEQWSWGSMTPSVSGVEWDTGGEGFRGDSGRAQLRSSIRASQPGRAERWFSFELGSAQVDRTELTNKKISVEMGKSELGRSTKHALSGGVSLDCLVPLTKEGYYSSCEFKQ
jgi:hypothetical protein